MSSADLLAAQRKLLATYPANYPFRPVVDGDFLPGIPLKLIANGSSAGVDLLIGTCRDESAAFVDPEHAAQPLDQKELGNAEIKDLAPVEAAYKSAFPDVSTPDLHIRMLTAEEYWIPCVRIAEARAAEQAPTFMYRFDHAPTAGRFANKSAHGSEQPFAWDHADQKTQLLASRIHAAWVAFIKTGYPASPDLPAWPGYQLPARSTMLLNDVSRVAFDPNGRERQIWNNRL
jgi:para-nitrobenzyl esterase